MRKLLETNVISRKEYDPDAERFTSSTGELILNRKESTLQIATPKSEAFVLPENSMGKGQFVSVRNKRSFASFLIASRDNRPLAKSRRILILHLTGGYNSGMRFANQERNIVLSPGTLPILMARGEAEIRIGIPGTFTLHACSFHGKRLFEVPLKREGESMVFTASNATGRGPVAVYELIRK